MSGRSSTWSAVACPEFVEGLDTAAILGPGTVITKSTKRTLEILLERL